mgnify:CR=1 FL=1
MIYNRFVMARISFAKLQEKYSGMYVLTDKPNGRVVAANRDLEKAFKEAKKKGYETPAVQFIPRKGTVVIYALKVSLRK